MHRHENTALTLEELGARYAPYAPSYDVRWKYATLHHWRLGRSVAKDSVLIELRRGDRSVIEGWLRKDDALKLYEMAYYAPGDILELGSYHGLSTTILAKANRAAGNRRRIVSVDLTPEAVDVTRETLRSQGLDQNVTNLQDDAVHAVQSFVDAGRTFGFVFVDHSHAYTPVYEVCRRLAPIVMPGGFCLFHDFNDPRNRDEQDESYGVYQAVIAGMDPTLFEFWGTYGCTALYRRIK